MASLPRTVAPCEQSFAFLFFSFFVLPFWFCFFPIIYIKTVISDISVSLKQLKNDPGKNRDNFCENCHGKKKKKKKRQVTTFAHCVTGCELHARVHVKKKFYGKFVS